MRRLLLLLLVGCTDLTAPNPTACDFPKDSVLAIHGNPDLEYGWVARAPDFNGEIQWTADAFNFDTLQVVFFTEGNDCTVNTHPITY